MRHVPSTWTVECCDVCLYDAFERVTEAGLRIRLIAPRLYELWGTAYHTSYEYRFNKQGQEVTERKADR